MDAPRQAITRQEIERQEAAWQAKMHRWVDESTVVRVDSAGPATYVMTGRGSLEDTPDMIGPAAYYEYLERFRLITVDEGSIAERARTMGRRLLQAVGAAPRPETWDRRVIREAGEFLDDYFAKNPQAEHLENPFGRKKIE